MDSHLKKRLYQTGIALIIIFITGTFGYYFITHQQSDLFTCFYMTVVTVTTIGYDEIIDVKTYTGGRPFTVFLAFSGIGILTYFVSTISAVIIEGQFKESFKKKIMEKSISKCNDQYIICGIGNHSMHIIDELIATQRVCICIDIDQTAFKNVLEKYPIQKYLQGDATHDDILIKAGIKNAVGLFATTNDDNINLVISLLARRLNPELRIISLCSNHNNQYKIKLAGADEVISPNYMGGLRMASEMLRPVATHFLDLMLSDTYKNLRIEEINLDNNSGKELGKLKLEEFKNALFVALKSGEDLLFKPGDDYLIKKGDLLLVIATPQDRIKLENIEL